MSRIVEVVRPDTPLREVAAMMERPDCSGIFVVKDNRLVGMITDRDIARHYRAEEHGPAYTTAVQLMSSEILYCQDSDAFDNVTKTMGEHKVRRMAVLDANKRLVGIVSLEDPSAHSNSAFGGH